MNIEIAMIIIGSFISIGLGLNAYFLKGIFSDLNNVKINIARIFERSKARDKTESDFEKKIEQMEEELRRLKERLHTLEGTTGNIFEFIKDMDKSIK